MFNLKEDLTAEQLDEIKQGLQALPEKVGVIQSFEAGFDLLLPSGQNHPAGKNRSVCLQVIFDSTEDYETYAAHPDHVAFLKWIGPMTVPGTRAAIQYYV
eukprot:TRINITY_DN11701_c0_g1_i1.p1 TRINITY_DN11701_c0_g1~~TRINITY_DN11701_c0_g1_i1.p1  ORF type:complete len:100 (-),score=15.15 TRINITY_DN11701_c0_g1_i1:154-453(-)